MPPTQTGKLHLFLKDFQETLAQAEVYLPDTPKSPDDLERCGLPSGKL